MGQPPGDLGFWRRVEEAGWVSERGDVSIVPKSPAQQFEPDRPPYLWLVKGGEPLVWPEWVKAVSGRSSPDDLLTWASGNKSAGEPAAIQTANSRGALDSFLKLADGAIETLGERVLAFARRWGPLGLCSAHGRPAPHNPACDDLWSEQVTDLACGSERIADWDRLVRRARGILRVSFDLHKGLAVSRELWGEFADVETTYHPHVRAQQFLLGMVVSQWLAEGRVRPILYWGPEYRGGKPTVVFSRATVFGVIAVQLAAAVVTNDPKGSSPETCSNCTNPIVRPRLTRRGYRVFCDRPDCQKAKWRLAKQDQRRGATRWTRTKGEESSNE